MVNWPVAVAVRSSVTVPLVGPAMTGASFVPVIVIVTVSTWDVASALPLSSVATTS